MKRFFLQSILRFISRAILKKYHPDIVAITGSVGKTGTKEAVASVLTRKFNVRKTEANYNTDIGVPFAIIGCKPPGKNFVKWMGVFLKACAVIIFPLKNYPMILVLELAADKTGDIAYFMTFIEPKVSILTSIAPVHMEKFGKLSRIVLEKRKIIEALPKSGYAVLNYDDKAVRKIAEKCVGRIFWYGLKCKEGAIVAEEEKVMEKDGVIGLYFKMLYKGTAIPVFVKGVAAKHELYSLLAGASVGMLYELTPLEVAHGLEQYKPEHGRFVLQKGIQETVIIDDTYNASPLSVISALTSLKELPVGKRRIAVLGDMLELGNNEEDAHSSVGEAVVQLDIGVLITYGKRALLISERAKERGMSKQNIRHFDAMEKLIEYVKSMRREGDVVLIKGSRGMKMERVVAALHLREK